MFEQNDFYAWRCVRTVINVVEQVPGRWQARGPLRLDETTSGLLLLWSWLRWESDFLTRCLEEQGVDLESLARQVDAMLKERVLTIDHPLAWEFSPKNPQASGVLRTFTAFWLNRAVDEARRLQHSYLGVEHLLLAFLQAKNAPIAKLFASFGIDHPRLTAAVLKTLPQQRARKDEPVDAVLLDVPADDWGLPRPGKPAVGMPKRFSLAIMMSWVTLFAIVFSLLKWMEYPGEVFGVVAVLMFSVGIGQMWLFGGKLPRAASIWTGAVTLPVVIFLLNVSTGCMSSSSARLGQRIFESIGYFVLSIPAGAFFGYLAGGLTAGIVLVLDYLEKRKSEKEISENEEDGGEMDPAEDKIV